MIDILVYLFANYHDFSARPKTRTLRRRLSAVGFNDEAIGVALRWLDGLNGAPLLDWPDGHRAMRIYVPKNSANSAPIASASSPSLKRAGC